MTGSQNSVYPGQYVFELRLP